MLKNQKDIVPTDEAEKHLIDILIRRFSSLLHILISNNQFISIEQMNIRMKMLKIKNMVLSS